MKFIKKTGARAAVTLMAAAVLTLGASAYEELVPMGCTVGIELTLDGVMVVETSTVETENGPVSPSGEAGILAGDVIVGVNGGEIETATDFLAALEELDGGKVELRVNRGGETLCCSVQPVAGEGGGWLMGLWLRDSVCGIGTVTYVDPASGEFGALGHGVCDVDTGILLPLGSGRLFASEVTGVKTGAQNEPGQLQGQFDEGAVRGSIEDNTRSGIFGVMPDCGGEALPVADEDEIRTGEATVLSNVSGDAVREFSVEITRVYRDEESDRVMMLTVTDPELLKLTGGIVQGM